MDHLVVRKRQHEIFVECVEQRKSKFAVMVLAIKRIERDVAQRIVHPAHVPFQIESQAAKIDGTRNRGPCRRFLRDRQRARMALVQHFIQPLDEGDGLQVLAAAQLIGNPLACFAGIIEVQHRGHGIHAQAVDVILVDPEKRVRQQEILHFVAAVVEDERAPIRDARHGEDRRVRRDACRRKRLGRARRAENARASNPESRRGLPGGIGRRNT